MKDLIVKVAKDLESGVISEDKAKDLLLALLGVKGSSRPLDVVTVSRMLHEAMEEAWVKAGGNPDGFKEWMATRNSVSLNSGNGR